MIPWRQPHTRSTRWVLTLLASMLLVGLVLGLPSSFMKPSDDGLSLVYGTRLEGTIEPCG